MSSQTAQLPQAPPVAPVTEEILGPARAIWSYLRLREQPRGADVLVAVGTNDLRVVEFAARLFREGYAPRMVCTGGVAHLGDLLATHWTCTEAEMFADVAVDLGVPREAILIEPRASNTTENVRFTRALLEQRGIRVEHVLYASKPFVQRRVRGAHGVVWPEMPSTVVSAEMTLEEYFTPELPAEKTIHIMMGDLQRVAVYGRRGWAGPQTVPAEVREAYARLAALGFTKQLIPGEDL
jgi:uncharacterized SAM-binding protein YcdF (DUF218 family)